MKIESENLSGNKIFENDERKDNYEVEKVRRENSVIRNTKYPDLIHVDLNLIELNKPLPDDSKILDQSMMQIFVQYNKYFYCKYIWYIHLPQ